MQYFELGIFSFNSYVYYLTRGFIASTRAFNLLTLDFKLPTRAFSLPTRAFSLATFKPAAFILLTPEFELITRGFELATRSFELVNTLLMKSSTLPSIDNLSLGVSGVHTMIGSIQSRSSVMYCISRC